LDEEKYNLMLYSRGFAKTGVRRKAMPIEGATTSAAWIQRGQKAPHQRMRIWQDANQDGVSQAHELRTLGELGIASINVVGQQTSINLGNGNTQPWSGGVNLRQCILNTKAPIAVVSNE